MNPTPSPAGGFAEPGRTVLFLVGPTASGKGAAAFEMALALGGDIVSMDSMKIYRGMDVGTAKPSAERRSAVRYHMLDLAWPWEDFDLRRYVDAANAAIGETLAAGRVPIVSGGTGMYLRGLLHGVFRGPPASPETRERLRALARERGVPHLHGMLAERDPPSASRIHPNDLLRIVRALEVIEATGMPISGQQTQKSARTDLDIRIAGINRSASDLRARIEARVEGMIRAGFADEVRRVWFGPRPPGRSARSALGYRTMAGFLEKGAEPAEAAAEIRKLTWRFSRRQMTWFRSFPRISWIDAAPDEAPSALAGRVAAALSSPA